MIQFFRFTSALSLLFSSLSATVLLQVGFDDDNGTNLSDVNIVSDIGLTGSWNFGGPKVQNGNLNWGVTGAWKWLGVDTNPGEAQFRKYFFDTSIDSTVCNEWFVE